MNRKTFLSGLGLTGVGALLPDRLLRAGKNKFSPFSPPACVLIPSETAGPFPLDLTENTTFFRQDIREEQAGVQFNLKMKIFGLANCEPMQNVRVNIWHCTKDGLYSGYNQNNNPGQAGLTYLRGYQYTDANGEVNFTTIFPGWYTGRICHIHFQVHVSSSYSAISQMTFDIATKNAIYAAHTDLYSKGADPTTLAGDNIFSDGYEYQVASLTANEQTGGYDGYLEVAVQGEGTVGVGHLEKEAAKYFALGQNFPNPYTEQTVVPFNLKNPADVVLSLWDLSGKKIYCQELSDLGTGDHQFRLSMADMGLASGNYVYQLEVRNSQGIFHLSKMMSAHP